MKLNYRQALLITSLLTCFTCVQGQPGYQFENFTETNGLSDNRVTCFLKDRTGFMWIGTENGLNRFDGHNFKVYRPGVAKRSISNPYINDIEEDGTGRLWIATNSGLNVISGDDSISTILPDENGGANDKYSIPSDLIWDIYADRSERLWIAADVKDLCYYDLKKKLFFYFPWNKYLSAAFPHRDGSYNSIRKIYYKSDDELWLGTSAGLFSYRISTNAFTYHKSYEADHFIQLETDSENLSVYFVQNPTGMLQELSVEAGTKKDIAWERIISSKQNIHPTSAVTNKRWLPMGKDIVEINPPAGDPIRISHRSDDPYSLPNGTVRIVYRENTANVWVGTSNGIGKFNPSLNLFHFTEVLPFKARKEVSENDLLRYDQDIHTVFYSKEDSKFYISSPFTNSLIILDKTSGQSRTIKHVDGIPLTRCSVIFEDHNGMLWILAGRNAFKYDRKTQRFSISGFRSNANSPFFTDMAEDKEGRLWFACLNDGLYRYDPEQNSSYRFSAKDGFNVSLPTSLYFDNKNNRLWIGSFEKGLYTYEFAGRRFNYFNRDKKDPSHIQSSLITDIIKDGSGTMWISTYADGIARISADKPVENGFTHLSVRDGLPENSIFSMQTDGEGNIWTTSFKGLTKLTQDGKVVAQYNRSKGLRFTDFNSPIQVTESGYLMTAIQNGFVLFHPDSLSYPSPNFPVIITAFRVKDSTYTKASHMILPYTDNEVQFDFTALTYSNPTQTRYEYRLQGIDQDWMPAENIPSTKYNNLAPGSYVFKVRAFDFTCRASSNEASYSFRILPPWWESWWFRIGTSIVIVGMIFFLLRRRIQAIKTKALVRQQMAELKGQALRAQMNPHFIFNSLNAIQELIITENYTGSYNYLSKFSKLLRLVLNMSEKNSIPLSGEIEMCRLYLELESLRFKHSFQYKIDVDESIDTDATMFPTLLVQPFIENAIWHGLLQKDGEKKLSLAFTEQDGKIVCMIIDNGIGREKAIAIKAQKIGAQYFDSKGMELAQKRVENLKASGTNGTVIEITDCRDKMGNATGTEVRIIISPHTNAEA